MKTLLNVITAIFLSCLFLNCGSTASIKKTDGTEISGRIIAGDDENIYIKTLAGQVPIKKSEISDIDHPGNGLAVTGGIITAYGILNIAVGVPQCEEEGGAFCLGVFTPAGIGIPMFANGFSIWNRSKGNVNKPRSTALNSYYIVPGYSFNGNRRTVGFAIVRNF